MGKFDQKKKKITAAMTSYHALLYYTLRQKFTGNNSIWISDKFRDWPLLDTQQFLVLLKEIIALEIRKTPPTVAT